MSVQTETTYKSGLPYYKINTFYFLLASLYRMEHLKLRTILPELLIYVATKLMETYLRLKQSQ